MALQIGDKVKFLNDEGGGKITQLIDKNTVMVLSDVDDFEIPMLISELIPMNTDESIDSKEFNEVLSEKRRGAVKGISLLFAEKDSKFDCYIFNGEDEVLILGVFEEKKEESLGVFSGMLQPYTLQKVASYTLKDFESILQWKIQGFYFGSKIKEINAPLDCVVKMHPKKFFNDGSKEFVEEIGKEAVIIPLHNKTEKITLKADDFFADTPKLNKIIKRKERKDSGNLLEVDLHIHELLETTKGMSNGEMLEYQLDTFRKVLTENKNNKGKKIVFIHGVGNGILKQRIRHELQKYPRYIVQDASFQEYGWGATMVVIK